MIYLDNSATTRPTAGVCKAMSDALERSFFNPSSMYAPALGVEKQLNACRDKIRAELNCPDAQVIFTSGGTEANNLALTGTVGVSRAPIRIAVSAVEHPSVYDTAALLEKDGKCETVILPVTPEGTVNPEALRTELRKGLTLVSVMQVNNETGALNDIPAISRMTRDLCPGCRLHVDGVQGFLREKIDMELLDLYSLSGHKIHAPKGIGALVVRKGLRLKASHTGGGQENTLRSGTENTPGIIALSQAIDEMTARKERRTQIMQVKLRLKSELLSLIPEAVINGPAPEEGACHILNVSFPGVRGETMLHALEEKGVLVSTGSACSSKKRRISRVLSEMGIPAETAESAIRFSLCPETTRDEVVFAAQAVKDCYEILRRFKRR